MLRLVTRLRNLEEEQINDLEELFQICTGSRPMLAIVLRLCIY
jgi:hypothetical protein